MKVAIVNGFDTFEHRAELLLSFFQTRNYDTVVLQSDFHHIIKNIQKVFQIYLFKDSILIGIYRKRYFII